MNGSILLFVILSLAGVVALYYLVVGVMILAHKVAEGRFIVEMKAQGRFKLWGEIEGAQPSGTVIIEQAQKAGCRVWWTPDVVSETSPHPVPDEEDLDYLRFRDPVPFVEWCAREYTSALSGKGFLTEVPFLLPPGFLTSDYLRSRTSITKVIATVKLV
ncbi:MAG: hypothetical protein AAF591_01845 [Verrucomicrobiota bacterium]